MSPHTDVPEPPGGLRDPLTAGLVVVGLLYAASLVLDVVASSYPPAPSNACASAQTATDICGAAAILALAGGVLSISGLFAASGRRGRYLALLVLAPILIVTAITSVLWPGANCQPI